MASPLNSLQWGTIMLWIVSAFPATLAVLLIATLAFVWPAAAAEQDSCRGTDLVEAFKKNDPQKYAALRAAADKIPNGNSIFWKIEKPGIQPSWLLGTMHVTDPRVLKMPQGAAEAVKAADTIIVESDEIVDEKKAAAAMLAHPELTMFTDGSTIEKYLSPAEQTELAADLKDRGIPLAAVSRMRPWMIASVVSLPNCEIARKADGVQFLDQKLAVDAAKAGKQVKGLETLQDQLQAMADLPMEFHLKSLIETLKLGETKMKDIMETMTDLYLSGQIGATIPLMKAVDTEDGEPAEDYAAFEQRIIVDRNKVMAERAGPLLEKGNAFMAVGALHLPGDDGVVALLRNQGFTLTPVR